MPERRPTSGTYRLQLHAGFGFADADAIVPYLAALGVSHLYLSPVLQASPGSMHGYDVVDHSMISSELGGRAGFATLAQTAHSHHLGIVVDVVPNHMAVPTPLWLNRQLWSVLRDGEHSAHAEWFDIDWELCHGKVGLPILAEPLNEAIAAGTLAIAEHAGSPVISYHEQLLPLRPGTSTGGIEDVLARQHYLLASWREKDTVLGYRRFFDVDTLIAVRVEVPEVFAATHDLLLDLHHDGVIDGFRIDHPDGLADPEAYLERLRDATGGAWVVVEKILGPGERLPATWACAGTTGYDAITAVQAAFVPPSAGELDALWKEIVADESPEVGLSSLATTESRAKSDVVTGLLQPEVGRLVRRAVDAAAERDFELDATDAQAALEAMLEHVEIYRAYLRLDAEPDGDAVARVKTMAAAARADRPDLDEPLETLFRLLTDTHSTSASGRDLVIRFQQVCGPVMAKGVEDTTFYRWHRFIALNEVGGDPLSLDDGDPERTYAWGHDQAGTHPSGLTTLSTHDTKRDEDVRARLLAAGEQPSQWRTLWSMALQLADAHGLDRPTAYLLTQTIIGAWPIDETRLAPYAEKAVREAKCHTTWTDPDAEYEARVGAFVRAAVDDGPLSRAVAEWVDDLRSAVTAVRLSTKLVQLTLPGVPDLYQGTELVQGFLVDPDNRRPVDYFHRSALLGALDSGSAPSAGDSPLEPTPFHESLGADPDEDRAKLWVVSRALRLRRRRPELFGAGAGFEPLQSTSECAWGFLRGGTAATIVQRWPSRLAAAGFGEAIISVPTGHWVDVLSGRRHTSTRQTSSLRCADVFAQLPVALLLLEET